VQALDEGLPIGYAHAGFGPNDDRSWIATDAGAICVVMVRPGAGEQEAAVGLIRRCEEYLRGRGARTIQGGGLAPLCPFYLGLYGGSEVPGVMDCDSVARRALAECGYREIARTMLLRRDLSGFESLIDRRQMQARRQLIVELVADAPTRTWWEASVLGEFDLTRFDLTPRTGGPPIASALFRSIEPSGTTSASRAVGLIHLSVDEAYRRRGLAFFLLSEALRQFLRMGIQHVETQIQSDDANMLALLGKLGFQSAEQGGVWLKE